MIETGAKKQSMKRRHLRIYRKRREKKTLILILICILLIGIAAAERIGYIDMEQFISDKQEAIPYQKVSKTAEENTEKYYYRQLPEEQKQVYREILEGVRNHTEEIYVHDTDADETNQIFRKLMKDQPDIFWCDGTATATTHKGTESYTVLKPKYFYTAKESQTMQTEITQVAAKWLAGLDADADEYQKILYVYEKIVDEVDYDESAPDNQNIYSIFVNRQSVCAGYSKATQYLLEQLGVFCTYVTGKTTEGGNHAWNLVKIGENYYYVDTTWSSSGFVPEEDSIQDFSYTYLCCTAQTLERSHVPDDNLTLPECKDDSYNYYKQNQSWYESYDEAQIYQVLKASILEKREKEDFKFANEEAYQQAVSALAEGNLIEQAVQEFYSFDGENSYRWNVGCSDAELLITVYW